MVYERLFILRENIHSFKVMKVPDEPSMHRKPDMKGEGGYGCTKVGLEPGTTKTLGQEKTEKVIWTNVASRTGSSLN